MSLVCLGSAVCDIIWTSKYCVFRGSKIFSSGWGAKRAAVYGVDEAELGKYYASRTLLGTEVVPESIAAAIFVLVGGDLVQTTGVHIPVDSGVANAFLR